GVMVVLVLPESDCGSFGHPASNPELAGSRDPAAGDMVRRYHRAVNPGRSPVAAGDPRIRRPHVARRKRSPTASTGCGLGAAGAAEKAAVCGEFEERRTTVAAVAARQEQASENWVEGKLERAAGLPSLEVDGGEEPRIGQDADSNQASG